MKIQLYSNCILTERYTEVFRTQALLESYLATLDSPLVQEIDIEDTYTKIVGTLCLDITQFSPDGETVESEIKYKTFNYIKFTDLASNNNRVSYAFVSSFSFANGLLVIDYVQDIWHTYLGTWSLRKSLVVNTLITRAGEPLEKPLPYIFNSNETDIYTMETPTYHDWFDIVIKVQTYDLSSGGNTKPIRREAYYIYRGYSTTGFNGSYGKNLMRANICQTLDTFNLYQQNEKWREFYGGSPVSVNCYARIVETYIIPTSWGLSAYMSNTEHLNYYASNQVSTTEGNTYRFSMLADNLQLLSLKKPSLL